MEVRIKITPENVDKVVQMIKELVYLESESGVTISGLEAGVTGALAATGPASRYLAPPPELENLANGKVVLTTSEAERVGTWGQFNSFFPIKAVLRILAHMMEENGGNPADLEDLVNRSEAVFRETKLSGYRGFPKKARKESSIGRLVWHFIIPAHHMGLIKVDGKTTEIPIRAWKGVDVSPTKQGLEFAKLENLILDKKEKVQILSEPERAWVIEHLKKIDGEGYKEYTFLKRVFEEFKRGNTDLVDWLEKDEQFEKYVKSWSKKEKNPKEFKKQIENVAAMFAQSKIALLRELGAISNERKDYSITGNFW